MKKEVAVKVINDEIEGSEVEAEVEILKKLAKAKNIIKFYRNGKGQFVYNGWEGEVEFIVLSYEKKGDLFEYIKEQGKLTEDIARFYFKQLLSATQTIHKNGWAHRDLKAENILLDN